MRVGQKQKKIDINIPKLDDFIHKVYINVARKVYKNVYLFEVNIPPLQIQKHHRELEMIIQESILNTVRESIPVEAILKAYMDETVEEDVVEEIKEQIIDEHIKQNVVVDKQTPDSTLSTTTNASMNGTNSRLTFDDIDYMKSQDGSVITMSAPKSIERLEEISNIRAEQRKAEEEDDDNNIKLKISDQTIELDELDVHIIDEPRIDLIPDLLIDDIEVLE